MSSLYNKVTYHVVVGGCIFLKSFIKVQRKYFGNHTGMIINWCIICQLCHLSFVNTLTNFTWSAKWSYIQQVSFGMCQMDDTTLAPCSDGHILLILDVLEDE